MSLLIHPSSLYGPANFFTGKAMKRNRPLSPHLQIYKLPLTGLISITHRLTGVMLAAGLVFIVYAVSAIAAGDAAYQNLQGILNLPVTRLLYWGFVFALFFHLCHGVRHLVWDSGTGFERDTMNQFAWIELTASVVLTATVFFLF